MEEFKGTQGEWKLSEEITHSRQMVDLGEWNGCIDVWHHHGNSMTKQEAIANANLIAAAPELLSALNQAKLFIDECSMDFEFTDNQIEMVNKINSAINKALDIS